MFLCEDEDTQITDLIVCSGETLAERKRLLAEKGDCIVVLPGGVGTLEETWEAISNRSMGLAGMERKPIILLNVDGFFDGTIQQIKRAGDDGLLYKTYAEYIYAESDPVAALDWIEHEVKSAKTRKVDGRKEARDVRLQDKVEADDRMATLGTVSTFLSDFDVTSMLLGVSFCACALIALKPFGVRL
jgi:hypothetical protein